MYRGESVPDFTLLCPAFIYSNVNILFCLIILVYRYCIVVGSRLLLAAQQVYLLRSTKYFKESKEYNFQIRKQADFFDIF